MRLDVYHHCGDDASLELLKKILKGQEHLMSKVTDFAAKEQADIDALKTKIESIGTGVADLKTLIVKLEGTLTGLTPEEQAALNAVLSSSDALVAETNLIDTTAPIPPPEPPVGQP